MSEPRAHAKDILVGGIKMWEVMRKIKEALRGIKWPAVGV
jgi:hypothetical protein